MKRLLVPLLLVVGALQPISAAAAAPPNPHLYSFEERPGDALPTMPAFSDSDGRTVHLGELHQGIPLIVVLAYFHCSSLCGLVRSSLYKALQAAKLDAGRDFALAVVSIDPHESIREAAEAKAADLAAFGPLGSEHFLHYLTGHATDIEALAKAVGFRDRFDAQSRQFMHPAGVVFVSPSGRVSNYLLGVGYTPSAVRSAVERARVGRIATAGSPLLLICFHFDPTTGRYSLEVLKVLRLAGLVATLTLVGMLLLLFRRERRSP